MGRFCPDCGENLDDRMGLAASTTCCNKSADRRARARDIAEREDNKAKWYYELLKSLDKIGDLAKHYPDSSPIKAEVMRILQIAPGAANTSVHQAVAEINKKWDEYFDATKRKAN